MQRHQPGESGWEDHLPESLFDLYTLECANKADKESCGEDCSLTFPREFVRAMGGPHVLAVMYHWQVLSHACLDPEHPVHHLFFCSTVCLANWAVRAKAEIDAEKAEEESADKRGDQ